MAGSVPAAGIFPPAARDAGDTPITLQVQLADLQNCHHLVRVRPTLRTFLTDDCVGRWAQKVLEANRTWLLHTILRHPALASGEERIGRICLGGGYDIVVILTRADDDENVPLPNISSLNVLPTIGVSVVLADDEDVRGEDSNSLLDRFGFNAPGDFLIPHVHAVLGAGANSAGVRVYLCPTTEVYDDGGTGGDNDLVVRVAYFSFHAGTSWRIVALTVEDHPQQNEGVRDAVDEEAAEVEAQAQAQAPGANVVEDETQEEEAPEHEQQEMAGAKADGMEVEANTTTRNPEAKRPDKEKKKKKKKEKRPAEEKAEDQPEKKKKAKRPAEEKAEDQPEKKKKAKHPSEKNVEDEPETKKKQIQASSIEKITVPATAAELLSNAAAAMENPDPLHHVMCYYVPFCLNNVYRCGGIRKRLCRYALEENLPPEQEVKAMKKKFKTMQRRLTRTATKVRQRMKPQSDAKQNDAEDHDKKKSAKKTDHSKDVAQKDAHVKDEELEPFKERELQALAKALSAEEREQKQSDSTKVGAAGRADKSNGDDEDDDGGGKPAVNKTDGRGAASKKKTTNTISQAEVKKENGSAEDDRSSEEDSSSGDDSSSEEDSTSEEDKGDEDDGGGGKPVAKKAPKKAQATKIPARNKSASDHGEHGGKPAAQKGGGKASTTKKKLAPKEAVSSKSKTATDPAQKDTASNDNEGEEDDDEESGKSETTPKKSAAAGSKVKAPKGSTEASGQSPLQIPDFPSGLPKSMSGLLETWENMNLGDFASSASRKNFPPPRKMMWSKWNYLYGRIKGKTEDARFAPTIFDAGQRMEASAEAFDTERGNQTMDRFYAHLKKTDPNKKPRKRRVEAAV